MADAALIDRLRLGDHLCWTFDDDAGRARAVTGSVRAGFRVRHRILYFTDALRPADALAELRAAGLDADSAADRGQLRVDSAWSGYLVAGRFDPQSAIDGWARESAFAHRDGYTGLRAVGDMAWASRPVPGGGRLPWYEAQVNRVFAGGTAMAVCLYDRRLFDPDLLARCCSAHPDTVGPGSGSGSGASGSRAPMLRITRTRNPVGIRLAGEVDLANRRALAAVLDHLFDDAQAGGQTVIVDLTELAFADLATTRMLVGAAATGPGRMRIVGCSPAMRRLLSFNGADSVAGLTVRMADTGPGPTDREADTRMARTPEGAGHRLR